MKPMDVIIDDLWKKITRDVSKDGRGAITEEQMLIAFQPGNSMDSMVQNLFGDDPLVYTAIKNGLIYKAKTGGAAITSEGALSSGMTTKAVQTKQRKEALGTQGLGQVSNMGAFGYTGVQTTLNTFAQGALTADAALGPLGGPLKIFNMMAAMLQTAGGAGGGIGNSVMGFLTALLGKMLPGKAEGGPVGNKTPYIVGEQGPELFIPKTDGTIIPNMDGKNPFRHHGGSVKATGPDMSKNEWAKALITKLGGSPTEANTSAVISWMAQEGGHWNNSAGYNPLNTTRNMPGAKLMDGGPGREHGVKHYTSWQQGLEATILTLTEKAKERGYDKIVNSIIHGKDQNRIMDAVYASKWGTGKGGGTGGGGSSGGGSNTQTDNPFKGTEFEKAYAEYLKTNTISDSTVSGLLKSGATGAGNTGLADMFSSMAGGSTINYGGVTFNITTPADNKSFIDSIKKALGDLNLGKLIGNK
jgi:hypothetical protein